jgi:hypothetical protein
MEMSSARVLALRWVALIGLCIFATSATPLAAQSLSDNVQIHGFGGWAYAETDGNYYTLGTPDGAWDNADFALNVTAEPTQQLTIVAQIRGEAVNGQDEFELDYAFAGWAFNDNLELRIGRVKHPFGIYGEIFAVGTLRPFYTLAQGTYGPVGFTANAYNGVGLAGWYDWNSGWGLQYDVYFGQIEGDFAIPGLMTTLPEHVLLPQVNVGFQVNRTIGGRVVLHTPVTGLNFGISGYTGDDQTNLSVASPDTRREAYLGSISYLNGPWLVRAEYGRSTRDTESINIGGYLEAAFKFTDHWQLAARFDTYELELPTVDPTTLPPFFKQFLEHEEVTLGLNYWFSSNFVVRLSYSRVEGNRFAFLSTPEEILELFVTGELESRTNMALFGAQFSF